MRTTWMTKERALFLLAFLWAPPMVTVGARAQSQGSPVVIGETVTIQSSILKESRSLLISKPAGYENGTDRYPVLYLLDGETHFHYTSGIVSFLAGNDRIPKMLLVGIVSGGAARRTRDLTPPSMAEIDNRFSPGNGGADRFLSFVADELPDHPLAAAGRDVVLVLCGQGRDGHPAGDGADADPPVTDGRLIGPESLRTAVPDAGEHVGASARR